MTRTMRRKIQIRIECASGHDIASEPESGKRNNA